MSTPQHLRSFRAQWRFEFVDTTEHSEYLCFTDMGTKRHRFSCVIFDMDGTLTQTNELIFASFNHVTEKYIGKTLTPREIIALFGPPEEGGLRRVLQEQDVESALNELCEFYQNNHTAMARLHDGVEEILALLKSNNVRLAVFTGKGRRTARITLDAFGLTPYFDVVISGNDVSRHKPDPEGIHAILNHFSVAPTDALMIGDGVSDVRASRAAGVMMGAVMWDCYDKERVLAEKADFIFHSTGELREWFLKHLN